MKKTIRIFIAAVSIVAMICAPFPQNVIASVSDFTSDEDMALMEAYAGDSLSWINTDGFEEEAMFGPIKTVYVNPGETVELSIPDFTVPEGSWYTIQWKTADTPALEEIHWDGDAIVIEGAEDSTYVTPPINEKKVYVAFVSDDFGNKIWVNFNVCVDSGLSWEDGTVSYYEKINILPGEKVTLTLPGIIINDGYSYSVSWGAYVNSTDLSGTLDENVNSIVTEPINEQSNYWFTVTDEYGNRINANYELSFDVFTGLSWESAADMDTEYLNVMPGEAVTLQLPNILINDGCSFTVSWSAWSDSASSSGTLPENETSLTTDPINETTRYEFMVSDGCGGYLYRIYEIKVNTGLRWVDTSDSWYDIYYPVMAGSAETLSVPQFIINDGFNCDIIWENSEGQTVGNGNTIDIPAVTANCYYLCRVSDSVGNIITAQFHIYIDTGLCWIDENNDYYYRYYTASPESSFTLAIQDFSINDGIDYSIEWYAGYADMGGTLIEEASGIRYYTTPELTGYADYTCKITDEYGNTLYAYFSISIESSLDFTGSSESHLTVSYGGEVTLTLPPFTKDDNLSISYQWYKLYDHGMNGSEIIERETYPILTLSNVTDSSTSYKCEISDGYNTIDAYFYITVATGLKWSDGTIRIEESLLVEPGHSISIVLPEYELMEGLTATEDCYLEFTNTMDYETLTPGADGTLVIENIQHNCSVSYGVGDGCGNSIIACYDITVDSGLSWADTSSFNKIVEIGVAPSPSYDFKIPALVYNNYISAEDLTYEWYLYETIVDNNWTYVDSVLQPDVTGDTFTFTDLREMKSGYVWIVDPYGNGLYLDFTITIDTGLSWEDGNIYGASYFEAPFGTSYDITIPNYLANDGIETTCTIEGLLIDPEYGSNWEIRAVSPGDVVSVGPIGNERYVDTLIYTVKVADDYGNELTYHFYYKNNFSLSWTNGTLYTVQNVNMNALDDTVTLELPEYRYDGLSDLTVNWAGAEGTVSEDSKSMTINGIEEPAVVYAKVSDTEGNSIMAAFHIGLESDLSFADGSSEVIQRIALQEGVDYELTLPQFNSDSPVTYQWGRLNKNFANGKKGKGTLGTDDTFVIEGVHSTDYYYVCYITDENGHSIRALYDLLVPSREYDAHGVSQTDGAYEAQTKYVSLTLDGRIGINLYVAVDASIVDQGAYAVMINGDDYQTVLLKNTLKGSITSESVYKLTYYVDAKDINDSITVSLFEKDGYPITMHNASGDEIDSYTTSVADYIERAGDVGLDSFRILVSDMSAYGNLVGTYFGTVTDYTISEDMADALSSVTAETVQEYEYTDEGNIPEGITYYGSSLVLDSSTSIYHYFKVMNGHSITDYSFTVDGEAVTPVAFGNMYRVEIKDIPAAKLGDATETHVAAVGDDFGYTISYSALSYVYAALVSFDPVEYEDLLNAVKALYFYSDSSVEYFNHRANDGGKM